MVAALYESLEPRKVEIGELFLTKDSSPNLYGQGLKPTKVFKLHDWGFSVISPNGDYIGNVHFDEPSRGILVKPQEGGLDRLLVGTTTAEDMVLFDRVRMQRYGQYIHHDDQRTSFIPQFETGFPLIYIWDKVIGSSRWAGDGENPQKGKVGQVVGIKHGLQSLFNRDYIIIGISGEEGYFEAWLSTLDLTERNSRNKQNLLEQKLIYLNDRVEISDRGHQRFGTTANVQGVSEHNGQLIYHLADEILIHEAVRLEAELAREFNDVMAKVKFDHSLYTKWTSSIKKGYRELSDSEFFELMQEGSFGLRDSFEAFVAPRLADKILKSNPEYTKREGRILQQSRYIREQAEFSIDANSVRLLEIYPPNKLFRTN